MLLPAVSFSVIPNIVKRSFKRQSTLVESAILFAIVVNIKKLYKKSKKENEPQLLTCIYLKGQRKRPPRVHTENILMPGRILNINFFYNSLYQMIPSTYFNTNSFVLIILIIILLIIMDQYYYKKYKVMKILQRNTFTIKQYFVGFEIIEKLAP